MLNFPAIGVWRPGQVHISWTESTRPIIAEVEQAIERTWDEASKRPGINLFDGPMCRMESFAARPEALRLTLSRTSYKPFFGTNLNNSTLAEKYGRPALANAVGQSALVISADGFLMLGRRTERVAYYPSRVHPFSGSLESSDDLDVFTDIRRELREELALSDDDIAEIICTGIAEDRSLLQPEIMFAARSNRTRQQIESKLDREEHHGIWSIPAAREALEQALRSGEAFTPIGVGSLLLWGRNNFGDEWLAASSPR